VSRLETALRESVEEGKVARGSAHVAELARAKAAEEVIFITTHHGNGKCCL
jgi:hypothetical protein